MACSRNAVCMALHQRGLLMIRLLITVLVFRCECAIVLHSPICKVIRLQTITLDRNCSVDRIAAACRVRAQHVCGKKLPVGIARRTRHQHHGRVCCRGPEQIVREQQQRDARKGGGESAVTPEGRAQLSALMEEGLGDHILLLRLFQVYRLAGCCCVCRESDAAGLWLLPGSHCDCILVHTDHACVCAMKSCIMCFAHRDMGLL